MPSGSVTRDQLMDLARDRNVLRLEPLGGDAALPAELTPDADAETAEADEPDESDADTPERASAVQADAESGEATL